MPRLRARSNADETRTWDSETSEAGFPDLGRGRDGDPESGMMTAHLTTALAQAPADAVSAAETDA